MNVHRKDWSQWRHHSTIGSAVNIHTSRKVDGPVQNTLDSHANVRWHLKVTHNLNQEFLNFQKSIFTHISGKDVSDALDRPWLSTRSSQPTARHALGFTCVQDTRCTMNCKTRGEFIDSEQRSKRAIRARTKELRTVGSRHLDKIHNFRIKVDERLLERCPIAIKITRFRRSRNERSGKKGKVEGGEREERREWAERAQQRKIREKRSSSWSSLTSRERRTFPPYTLKNYTVREVNWPWNYTKISIWLGLSDISHMSSGTASQTKGEVKCISLLVAWGNEARLSGPISNMTSL